MPPKMKFPQLKLKLPKASISIPCIHQRVIVNEKSGKSQTKAEQTTHKIAVDKAKLFAKRSFVSFIFLHPLPKLANFYCGIQQNTS